jgi:hypothetical protein
MNFGDDERNVKNEIEEMKDTSVEEEEIRIDDDKNQQQTEEDVRYFLLN